MSISLSGFGTITPVEQGGTERFELGYGLLVGNGQLPIITLEASGDGYPAYINGRWVMTSNFGDGGSNFSVTPPLTITNNVLSFSRPLSVSQGGTGATSFPAGMLKSDGQTINQAIANVDYVLPNFNVDGGVY